MLKTRRSFFTIICAIVFLIGGTIHGMAAFGGWSIVIDSWVIPQWANMLGSVVGYLMAISALSHLK